MDDRLSTVIGYLYTLFGYVAGVSFLLFAFIFFIVEVVVGGIFFTVMGLFALPPIRNRVTNRTGIGVPAAVVVLVVLVSLPTGVILGAITAPDSALADSDDTTNTISESDGGGVPGSATETAPTTPTPNPTATVSPTDSSTQTVTTAPTPTSTPTPVPTPTSTPTATPTSTPIPTPTPTAESTPTPRAVNTVRISSIQADAPGDEYDNLNGEYIVIENTASRSIDLSGWTVSEGDGVVYTFREFRLDSGASVTLHTGSGSDTSGDLYWGRSQPVWNNAGDTATLRNEAGEVVDRESY